MVILFATKIAHQHSLK